MNSVIKPNEWWAIQKFGKIRLKNPATISTGYRKKMEFVCECGNSKFIIVRDVTSGKTSSCGKCNEMPPEWWHTKTFGKLRLKQPKILSLGSSKKEVWICECGKNKPIIVKDVTNGKTTSCNNCHSMPPDWWAYRRFGRLRIKFPKQLHQGSRKKEIFVCVCGNEKRHVVYTVTSGLSRSCGHCSRKISEWYLKNRKTLATLKTPIPAGSIPLGGPIQLETVHRVDRPFLAICPHCGDKYRPRFSSIKSGKSLTCGCSAGMISRPSTEIHQFIVLNGFESELEYELSGYKYDVCVKPCKTLIEFQGSRYHSSAKQKERDQKKKALAEIYGYELIQIDEKLWNKKSTKDEVKINILSILMNRKGMGSGHKCKSEILAKIEELNDLIASGLPEDISTRVNQRVDDLMQKMKTANEDIMSAAISSHHVMCAIKNMKPNEAFGNDPFIYYALGLVGEAGELTGALLRAIRNGDTVEGKKTAVESELADCIIYAVILAYATGIDLVKIVNDKARIVEARARAGYYGGPIH